MRSSICEPGLVRRVEDGRRDLADAAAEPGLELAVDDHRRLLEALLGRALARRAVERERLARRDQRAVDQLRDESDVVQAARDAAVGRVVAADDAGDPHRLRVGRGALGGRRADGELGGPSGRRGRGREERLRGRRHVDAEAGLVRDDRRSRRPARPSKPASTGARSTVLRSLSNQASAPGPGDRDLRLAARPEATGARRSASAAASSACPRTRAGRAPRARVRAWRAAGARSAAVDLDRIDADGQRHRLPPRSSRASVRTIVAPAAFRSSLRPAWPGTTSIASPRRTSLASTWRRSIASARPASLKSSAARVRLHRAARSRRRRTAPAAGGSRGRGRSPLPRGRRVSIAAAQSASTPSVVALIG